MQIHTVVQETGLQQVAVRIGSLEGEYERRIDD